MWPTGAFYGTKKGEEISKLGPIEIFLKVMITSIYSHKSQNGNRKMCPAGGAPHSVHWTARYTVTASLPAVFV